MRVKSLLFTALLAISIIVFIPVKSVYAQQAPTAIASQSGATTAGVMDTEISLIQGKIKLWTQTMTAAGLDVFGAFAIIGLVIAGAALLFNGVEFSKWLHELVQFVLVTGVFYWFLDKAPYIATMIVRSFIDLGKQAAVASGLPPLPGQYGVSGLLGEAVTVYQEAWGAFGAANGHSIILEIFHSLTLQGIWAGVEVLLLGLMVSVVLFFIAIELMMAWIQVYIVMYGGIFFLAFGGWTYTRDIAIGYLKTIVSKGAYLMGGLLIAALSVSLADQAVQAIGASAAGNALVGNLSVMTGAFLTNLIELGLMLVLMKRVPSMLGQLAFGGGSMLSHSTGGAMTTVASGVAAAAGAAFGGVAGAKVASGAVSAGFSGGPSAGGGGGTLGGGGPGMGGRSPPGPMISDAVLAAAGIRSASGAPARGAMRAAAIATHVVAAPLHVANAIEGNHRGFARTSTTGRAQSSSSEAPQVPQPASAPATADPPGQARAATAEDFGLPATPIT